MRRVLFVCVHNSARSQMAEAFLNRLCESLVEAESAGLEPGVLNPLVVEAMAEVGIDISGSRTKSVDAVLENGRSFSHVVTVCDEASAERCPVVPGASQRLHWSFPDPSAFEGAHADRLARVREVRDAIRSRVELWCEQTCGADAPAG